MYLGAQFLQYAESLNCFIKNSNFRHHYAVNVNFPVVSLVVDGEEWTDQKDNPEIIDDWPLHNAGDITTKISIGACWQGMYVIVFVGTKQVSSLHMDTLILPAKILKIVAFHDFPLKAA